MISDNSDITPSVRGARLLRIGGGSLGTAFLEGFRKTKGDVVVLMDGDGSHRPEDLPRLIDALDGAEIVIGSKFVAGGRTEDSFARRVVSRAFGTFTRVILGIRVRDPMSGFMAAKREVIERTRLNPKGFKVVLELVYKSGAKAKEVPITFAKRIAGKSKVGFNVRGAREAFRIAGLLFELRFGARASDGRNITYLKSQVEGRI